MVLTEATEMETQRAENNTLRDQNIALKAENAQLCDRDAFRIRQLASRDKENDELRKRITVLLADADKAKIESDKHLAASHRQIEELTTQNAHLIKQNEFKTSKLTALQSKEKDNNDLCLRLSDSQLALVGNANVAKCEIERHESDYKTMKNELEFKIATLQGMCTELSGKLNEANIKIAKAGSEIGKLAPEIEKLDATITKLSNENTALDVKKMICDVDIHNLKFQNTEMVKEVTKRNATIADLSKTITELESKNKESDLKYAKLAELKSLVQGKYEMMTDVQLKQWSDLVSTLDPVGVEFACKIRESTLLHAKNCTLKIEIGKLKTEISELRVAESTRIDYMKKKSNKIAVFTQTIQEVLKRDMEHPALVIKIQVLVDELCRIALD